jgi:hypothetical protein
MKQPCGPHGVSVLASAAVRGEHGLHGFVLPAQRVAVADVEIEAQAAQVGPRGQQQRVALARELVRAVVVPCVTSFMSTGSF